MFKLENVNFALGGVYLLRNTIRGGGLRLGTVTTKKMDFHLNIVTKGRREVGVDKSFFCVT